MVTRDTATAIDFEEGANARTSHQILARWFSTLIHVSLLLLMVIAAMFYGGSDPWWKGFCSAVIFIVGIIACGERLLRRDWQFEGVRLILPIVGVVLLALLQSIPFRSGAPIAGINSFWNAISADPYESRFVALQLGAIALLTALWLRYATTEKRVRGLINVVIAIALASALFGILRQTMQHANGFVLPLLQVDQGYGQFINKNHFAYVMEMGLGLAAGMLLAGGAGRERALIYLSALLPVWVALVLSNSRGAILAMLAQLIFIVLVLPRVFARVFTESHRVLRILSSPAVRLVLVLTLVVGVAAGAFWVGGDRLAASVEGGRVEIKGLTGTREGVTRTEIWHATLLLIRDYPLLGSGLGGYWIAITPYHRGSGLLQPQQAHNDYFELISGGGVVGLALGVWFFIELLRRIRTNLRSTSQVRRATCFAAATGIVGIAVHSIFDFGVHRMLNAMLFTALIVIASYNLNDENDRLITDG